MKGDNFTWLNRGVYRDRFVAHLRATLKANTSKVFAFQAGPNIKRVFLFSTSKEHLGDVAGEIDIIEGVHDNQHNQVAWHTKPGCRLTPEANFTGKIVVCISHYRIDGN
ncbi:hypothetical protein DXG03_007504 [Asterophora parasitica]|uniref:Uncharacterized protein n=1 Tax=Asterophora parasitica TaxID=117018 RepID=A0A9P7KBS7_9AGAR|nr:hypothetical protein DXG03_007504 [Asterophora parasitica]